MCDVGHDQSCPGHHPESRGNNVPIILSSLCTTNILFGFGILIDFGAFISGKQSIIGFLLTSFSLISSLIHISLLTLERFVAVRYPFKYQTFDTKYIFYALAVIWCFSIGIAVATRYHYNTFLLVLCVVVLCSNVVVVISYGYVIFRTRCSRSDLYNHDVTLRHLLYYTEIRCIQRPVQW